MWNVVKNIGQGIGNVLGIGTQSYAGYKGQQLANKTNIALAEQARSHDVEMWNKQNEYNTPAMQMQRLKEAGLNPNLIYGSGSTQTGQADAPKQAPHPTVSNELATLANQSLLPILSQYNDWQVKKAQIRNIEEEANNKQMTNTILKHTLPYAEQMAMDKSLISQGQSEITRYKARTGNQAYKEMLDTYPLRKQTLESRLNESGERIKNLQERTRQTRLQADLDQQLKPLGMTTSDELWQRVLAMFLNRFKIIK